MPPDGSELDGLWATTLEDGSRCCILTTDIVVEHVYREWERYEGTKREFLPFFSSRYEGTLRADLTYLTSRIDEHDKYLRNPPLVVGERDEDGNSKLSHFYGMRY